MGQVKPDAKGKLKKHKGHNEGSVKQRKDGLWEARYTVGGKRKSIYGKSEEEVKKRLKLILADITRGDYQEECKKTLYDWCIEWLKTYKKNSVTASTYDTHLNSIECHIKGSDIGGMSLSKLKPMYFQKFYNKKLETISASTIRRLHVVIKCALKQAVDDEYIPKNPCTVTPPSINKPDIRILTHEEQDTFTQGLKDERFRVLFLFAMQTGVRIGELMALKWTDLSADKKQITIRRNVRRLSGTLLVKEATKTKAGKRDIPLMPNMTKELEEHKKLQNINKMKNRKAWGKNEWLFPNEYGQLIEPRRIQEEFKKILAKCELPDINFHALRHTFVSRLIEAGENPKTICELIGHTKVAYMLDTYAHILPKNLTSAIEKITPIFQKNQQ